jgi:hypothetical protein
MIQCSICKEFYNQELLSEVFEHQHKNISTDKEYYGKKINPDDPLIFDKK